MLRERAERAGDYARFGGMLCAALLSTLGPQWRVRIIAVDPTQSISYHGKDRTREGSKRKEDQELDVLL